MSPALNRSSGVWCFKHNKAFEIQQLLHPYCTFTSFAMHSKYGQNNLQFLSTGNSAKATGYVTVKITKIINGNSR